MTIEEERDRYKGALVLIANFGKALRNVNSIAGLLVKAAEDGLRPVPQYRDEEVVRWLCPTCNRAYIRDNEVTVVCDCDGRKSKPCIKLTGTRRVEVKPKVKRREEVQYPGSVVTVSGKALSPNSYTLFAEWEEQP